MELKIGCTSLKPVDLPSEYNVRPDDIVIENEVGEGSTARVFKAHFKNNQMKIALRKVKLIDGSTMRMNELKSETLSLIKLNHPNVVKTIGLCVEERGIVQEYCSKLIDKGDFGTEINSLKTLLEMMGSNSNLEI